MSAVVRGEIQRSRTSGSMLSISVTLQNTADAPKFSACEMLARGENDLRSLLPDEKCSGICYYL